MVNHKNEDSETLKRMIEDLSRIPRIYQPSKFWQTLNQTHRYHLTATGFTNFKRSISGKYFSWGMMGLLAHQLLPMLLRISRRNIDLIKSVKFDNYGAKIGARVRRFDPLSAQIYRVYLALLYDFVTQVDRENLLKKLEEPQVGNPFIVSYQKRVLSQDLMNSIYEYYSIIDSLDKAKIKEIVELGAGYGRLAYVFLLVLPNVRYTIVDIPPALYVSQRYLSEVFPQEKIFTYRRFKNFRLVQKEFDRARIRFLMADQVKLIPNNYFDLAITVSSLHEMTRAQIKKYLQEFDRVTRGFFYHKQWRRARTAVNSHITFSEYPIPARWRVIYFRARHPIQRWFFDAFYRTRTRG